MTEFSILTRPLADIEFAPESLTREIAQNVRCILSTRRGSVPLDRAFGLNFELLDRPGPTCRQLLEADIVSALAKYEPRIAVTAVEWARQDEAGDGALYPKVFLRLKEGRV